MPRIEKIGSGSAVKKARNVERPTLPTSIDDSGQTQEIKELKSLVFDLAKINTDLQGQLKGLKSEIDQKIATEINDVKQRLEDIKIRNIEGLAIFIGFFTFISIDFQVIKNARDWFSATGLVCLSAGLLIGFLLFMDYILVENRPKNRVRGVVGFCVTSIIIGLVLLGVSFKRMSDSPESNDRVVVNNNPVTSGGSVQVSGYAAPTSTPVFPTSASTTR